MTSSAKIPPADHLAEQVVLGSIIADQNALTRVIPILNRDDFFYAQHQYIYEEILKLVSRGRINIDLVSVGAAVKSKIDMAYLAALTDNMTLVSTIESTAKRVQELAIARRLIQQCTQTANVCFDGVGELSDILDKHQQNIFNLTGRKDRGENCIPTPDLARQLAEYIDYRFNLKDPLSGVASGYHDLDKLTGGFQKSDLIVIAGRPSMGKTALALNIACHVGKYEKTPVGVMSLEMSKEQLGLRCVASLSGVSTTHLRSGNYSESFRPRISNALEEFARFPIRIDDTSGQTVLELRAKARRMKMEMNIGLLIVDYLQLMVAKDAPTREQEISQISRGLKGIAKELDIPVIVLSQLNRSLESRPNKRPMMSDLRESGAIEQDADVIIFVYRDDVYNKAEDNPKKGLGELIIEKQRNGPVGTVTLVFRKEVTSFENFYQNTTPFTSGIHVANRQNNPWVSSE